MSDQPVALVTGGARRIGRRICQRLHQSGYNILLHYRHSAEEAQSLAAELNQARSESVVLLKADLLNAKDRSQLIQQAINQWHRLDVLINNASSFYPLAVADTTEENWDDLVGSNLKAPFFLSQGLADALVQQQGCIINLVDIHSERPLKGYPVYSIAKAGTAMLTQALAKELAPAVRVNGVSPGPILLPAGEGDTEQAALLAKTPMARMGNPDDIADTVLFLLQQSYITGQIIAVDGGKSLYS